MIALLILVPFALGLLFLFPRPGRSTSVLAALGVAVQAGLALWLAVTFLAGQAPISADFEFPYQEYLILGVELLLAAWFAVRSVRAKRLLPLLLALVQAGIAIAGEASVSAARVGRAWTVDGLGVLMVLVIGLVGGLIVLYSLGYMRRFHQEHREVPDRRRTFLAVFFVFLGAMYGLVLSDDLRLTLLFWEITTWASFVLIGYSNDTASRRSAFLALTLNLLGGIAFAGGNLLLARTTGNLSLSALGGAAQAAGLLPLALIALAGLVKSAQFPFTPWLLGAMVAPTPVSALLHSSTMVKAGVFLLLRLSPALAAGPLGPVVVLVGILSFVGGAFLAVSQRNSKRVLALSTVSNLGLIVVCAGMGTPELLWAAFFLVLFHAVAKALLFLGVGTASLGTGSLDVEEMGGLLVSMPRLAVLMTIGITGMFVAPFGMLVSKWKAMEAFIFSDAPTSLLVIACLAWGSATTVFFWTKWLGIMLRIPDPGSKRGLLEGSTTRSEGVSEILLAAAALLSFVAFPLASGALALPWLAGLPGGAGFSVQGIDIVATLAMVALMCLLPPALIVVARRTTTRLSPAYLSGREAEEGLVFKGTAAVKKEVVLQALYLDSVFPERILLPAIVAVGIILAAILLGTALV